jgi:hypothetical protein
MRFQRARALLKTEPETAVLGCLAFFRETAPAFLNAAPQARKTW